MAWTISNKKIILTTHWSIVIVFWLVYDQYCEKLNKTINNPQQDISEETKQQLISTLNHTIYRLENYLQTFSILGIIATTSIIAGWLLQIISPEDDENEKQILESIFKLPRKITVSNLKKIKEQLIAIGVKIQCKNKSTLFEETNNVLTALNIYLEKEELTNTSYWQWLKQYLITDTTMIESHLQNELHLLKNWLEEQKLFLNPKIKIEETQEETSFSTPIISPGKESFANIASEGEKILSKHFFQKLWPKWFTHPLTNEDKILLNNFYQTSPEKDEKKIWKILKINTEEINKKGVKAFLTNRLQTTKSNSNIALLVNQETRMFHNLAVDNKKNIIM